MNWIRKRAIGIPKNLGLTLLCIWLILNGFIILIDLRFAGLNLVMGILAIAAGILFWLEQS